KAEAGSKLRAKRRMRRPGGQCHCRERRRVRGGLCARRQVRWRQLARDESSVRPLSEDGRRAVAARFSPILLLRAEHDHAAGTVAFLVRAATAILPGEFPLNML